MEIINRPQQSGSRRDRGLYRLRRWAGGWDGVAGVLLVSALVLIAIAAPLIARTNPDAIDANHVLGPPVLAHPFGFDDLGRDVFSRVVFALRVSMTVAIVSVLLALISGTIIGIVAGYGGGVADSFLMRGVDLLLAFPALLLAIGLIAIVGPGSLVVLVAIAVLYLPIFARVVRGSVLTVRHQPFVQAAQARGASQVRIAVRHVLPNSLGPAISQACILTAFAIQLQAALSFVGLGAQPPTSELGLMLYAGRDVLGLAPWVELAPGVVLAFVVLGFVLLGNGLAARLDPAAARE